MLLFDRLPALPFDVFAGVEGGDAENCGGGRGTGSDGGPRLRSRASISSTDKLTFNCLFALASAIRRIADCTKTSTLPSFTR